MHQNELIESMCMYLQQCLIYHGSSFIKMKIDKDKL